MTPKECSDREFKQRELLREGLVAFETENWSKASACYARLIVLLLEDKNRSK